MGTAGAAARGAPPDTGAARRAFSAGLGRSAPLCVAALLAGQGPALAQDEAADAGRLARAVLAAPSDLDLGYRYARALIAEGRFRDAAAELERMLVIEPDQPRLRLELGVLYFRLGSYEVARSYLERALEAPDLPEAARERVRRFLDEAERRTRRSVLAGSLSFGGRYQSNANFGVRHDVVNGVGADDAERAVQLPPSLRQREDFNAYIGAALTHSYDLEWQREAAIVSSLGLAATRQTSAKFYNFAGFTFRSGLRFAPAPDSVPSLRLYPYVRTDLLLLNDHYYNGAAGPGLEASVDLSARWTASLVLEQRFADYSEAPRAPRANVLTGDERLYLLRLGRRISPDLLVLLQGGAREVGTKQASFNFTEYGVTGGVSALYPAPLAAPGGSTRWNAVASVSHYWREYGGPDPAVSLTRTRRETEWRVRVVNEVPVVGNWSAVQLAEYWRTNANLPNYDRGNLIVALGLTLRF